MVFFTGVMGRNYRQEYDRYHANPAQKKRRANRNTARRLMIKKVGKKRLSGKDVHHKNRNGKGKLSSSYSNLRIQSKSKNRSNNQ